MEENSKTNIQLNNTEIVKLQNSLKPGSLLPVTVLEKLGKNYYAIRIKNVRLKAYSDFDLSTRGLLVRVRELFPVPVLQLIFFDNELSEEYLSNWSEELDNISSQDVYLLKKYADLLINTKTSVNLKGLLEFIKKKQTYQIIPMSFYLQSGLSESKLNSLYYLKVINKPNLKNGLIYLEDLDNILKEPIINSEINELKSLSKIFKGQDFTLAYYLLNLSNSAILIPVEIFRQNQQLIKLNLIYPSRNYGNITINALYSDYWRIRIEFENSIYQKVFEKDIEQITLNLQTLINDKVKIYTEIADNQPLDYDNNLVNICING